MLTIRYCVYNSHIYTRTSVYVWERSKLSWALDAEGPPETIYTSLSTLETLIAPETLLEWTPLPPRLICLSPFLTLTQWYYNFCFCLWYPVTRKIIVICKTLANINLTRLNMYFNGKSYFLETILAVEVWIIFLNILDNINSCINPLSQSPPPHPQSDEVSLPSDEGRDVHSISASCDANKTH